ncbi:hypothetical protein [Nonomuraea jiangxiensis]|uniref:Peptidase inhibitor family I36 n=1 Tax=Nonomuraea jiangxiensis TaxID=633440 RepID=A0A1G9RDL5_9ACTN|nr:hypothetical protein [Nonomuraea jiangxiensis]SDM20535.1 hypothetical protein SAMN05421869_13830 [Nonomuraea jiangxiensis]
MTSRSTWRRALAAASIVFATVTLTETAAAAERTAPVPYCPGGYLCLLTASGSPWTVLVAEGERRSFPDGLAVLGVDNQTQLNYCVNAKPFRYGLAPGRETTHSHTVQYVSPSQVCVF